MRGSCTGTSNPRLDLTAFLLDFLGFRVGLGVNLLGIFGWNLSLIGPDRGFCDVYFWVPSAKTKSKGPV